MAAIAQLHVSSQVEDDQMLSMADFAKLIDQNGGFDPAPEFLEDVMSRWFTSPRKR